MSQKEKIKEAMHSLQYYGKSNDEYNLRLHKNRIIEGIKYQETLFKSFPQEHLNEKIVEEMVTANSEVYKLLPLLYKENRKIVLAAVKKSGILIKEIPVKFLDDREVVFEAVNKNGYAFLLVMDKYAEDKEIIARALKSRAPSIYGYLSDKMKRDRELIQIAMKSSNRIYFEIPDDIASSKEFLLENKNIFLEDPKTFKFALSLIEKYEREDRLLSDIEKNTPSKQKRKI